MKRKSSPEKPHRFKRITISLPLDLWPFVELRTAQPQHSWSVSSYLRGLVVKDQAEQDSNRAAHISPRLLVALFAVCVLLGFAARLLFHN